MGNLRVVGAGLVSVVVGAVIVAGATGPAHATVAPQNGLLSLDVGGVSIQSDELIPAYPGEDLTITVSAQASPACNAPDGTNVYMALLFANSDGVIVGNSMSPLMPYVPTTDPSHSYSWTSFVPWMTEAVDGQGPTKNTIITYSFACYLSDFTDVSPVVPIGGGLFNYLPVTSPTEPVGVGESVSFSVHDATPSASWCGGVLPQGPLVTNSGSSMLVHLVDGGGASITAPPGWAPGAPALGLYDDLTKTITGTFEVPSGLTAGDYAVSLECVTSENVQSGNLALSSMTVKELPVTGRDGGVVAGCATLALATLMLGGLGIFAARRARRDVC